MENPNTNWWMKLLDLVLTYVFYIFSFHVGLNAILNPFGFYTYFPQSLSIANGIVVFFILVRVFLK